MDELDNNSYSTYPTYLYPQYANKSIYFRSVVTFNMYIKNRSAKISITSHPKAVLDVIPNCSGVNLKIAIKQHCISVGLGKASQPVLFACWAHMHHIPFARDQNSA